MVQGTGSHVGKSVIVAGLCRALANRGLRVAPFKPQNMSNNAAVTVDGGEIGRAQALQARAARRPPSVHINPVLLKPETDTGAQVIVQGRRIGTLRAREYGWRKRDLLTKVLESFAVVGGDADIVLVEGAGSPAEVNLRDGDIANMGFAEAANLPVILVGDIDRGGVIASLVGTHAVFAPGDRQRIAGFLINKFRGDAGLLDEGLAVVGQQTGWPCLGVIPWSEAARALPAEDVLGLTGDDAIHSSLSSFRRKPESVTAVGARPATFAMDPGFRRGDEKGMDRRIVVAVPHLPRIANFDDLDPLRAEPGVSAVVVEPGTPIPAEAKLILIPGSKSTIADLAFLREQGWDIDIQAHRRRGGQVLGVCGGYQMLGRTIADPQGIEGRPRTVKGLGLLDVETTLTGDKTMAAVNGHHLSTGQRVSGYEIHLGQTSGPDTACPMLELAGRLDGAVSADRLVAGSYVHGIFAADGFRRAFLAGLGVASTARYEAAIETALDDLAAHLEKHLDIDRLIALAGLTDREAGLRPAAP